jgi:hypothetical protein
MYNTVLVSIEFFPAPRVKWGVAVVVVEWGYAEGV